MKKFFLFGLALVILLFSCSLNSELTQNNEDITVDESQSKGIGGGGITLTPLGSGLCDVDYHISVVFDQLTYCNLTIIWSDGYRQYDTMSISPPSSNIYGSVQRRNIPPGAYRVKITGYAIGLNTSYTIGTYWSAYAYIN